MNGNLVIRGRRFEKIHIARHADPVAGFCALVTYALNDVRMALENNWLPVINYDSHINHYFFDPERGNNVWDYYFEPVMDVNYEQIEQWLRDGEISQDMIHTYPPDLVLKWHNEDPERLCTFWGMERPSFPGKWMEEKRQLGREYVASYIHVKPHICAIVDDFCKKHFQSGHILGVHIRGTDFAYAEPTRVEIYFRAVHDYLAKHQIIDFDIFVATDQSQFVEAFEEEFPGRVITYDSARSSTQVPAFLSDEVCPYKKGEDVLVDVLLLSRCSYLFKGAAAVGEFALWFNPALMATDFALTSRRPRHADTTAYLTLNVGKMSAVRSRVLRHYSSGRRAFLNASIKIGRVVLPAFVRDWLWQRFGRRIYVPGFYSVKADSEGNPPPPDRSRSEK